MVDLWPVTIVFLIGVLSVVGGVFRSWIQPDYIRGIWPCGIGVVMVVLALFLFAGFNDTAYYPSTADMQSSLTLANSCSSEFTLRTMAVVSLLVPFVLAYIVYAWRKIDCRRITQQEIAEEEAY